MTDMSWIEIYFYIGVVWSFVDLVVSLSELVSKKPSKSLNLKAKSERQAKIEEFHEGISELGTDKVKFAGVLMAGFFIAAMTILAFWPAYVYKFVRNRT